MISIDCQSQGWKIKVTTDKTYRPLINLVHILSMMRKYRSKVSVTMNTYRNKHLKSIALNPAMGYIKRKFLFPHQSLLCPRGVHTFFVWRSRKPINLAQVCLSNDRAVPTPGFKQYNSLPTPTKTTKQTYRSFENFYFDFLVLVVYTSVMYCFQKCLKFLGEIIASVLQHNSMWSFDVEILRSLLIGVQQKLELQEKKKFFSVDIAKKRYSKIITRICYQFTPVLTKTVHYWFPHHCNKNDYFLPKFKANISTLDTQESQRMLLSYTIIIIRNRYIFHYKILLLIATNPVLGEIMTDSPS